jgi:hypothetical protein
MEPILIISHIATLDVFCTDNLDECWCSESRTVGGDSFDTSMCDGMVSLLPYVHNYRSYIAQTNRRSFHPPPLLVLLVNTAFGIPASVAICSTDDGFRVMSPIRDHLGNTYTTDNNLKPRSLRPMRINLQHLK